MFSLPKIATFLSLKLSPRRLLHSFTLMLVLRYLLTSVIPRQSSHMKRDHKCYHLYWLWNLNLKLPTILHAMPRVYSCCVLRNKIHWNTEIYQKTQWVLIDITNMKKKSMVIKYGIWIHVSLSEYKWCINIVKWSPTCYVFKKFRMDIVLPHSH